jgi:bacterioferritin-associated ferredoxin
MYVCVCNGVTERDIRQAVAGGCRSITELTMRTGCGATCGSCVPTACELLDEIEREAAAHAHGNVVPFRHAQNAA